MSKYHPKKGDDVAVYWHDACSGSGWRPADKMSELSKAAFRTVGVFAGYSNMKFTKGKPRKSILLASTTSITTDKPLDEVGDCHSIPVSMVLEIKKL